HYNSGAVRHAELPDIESEQWKYAFRAEYWVEPKCPGAARAWHLHKQRSDHFKQRRKFPGNSAGDANCLRKRHAHSQSDRAHPELSDPPADATAQSDNHNFKYGRNDSV